MIGPRQVGFGVVAGAGQVLRRDVPDDRLVIQTLRERERPFPHGAIDLVESRAAHNIRYIAELLALRAWYSEVRLRRVPEGGAHEHLRIVTQEALATLDLCLAERQARYAAFLRERHVDAPPPGLHRAHSCPLVLHATAPYTDHVAWVQRLADDEATALGTWLSDIVRDVVDG